jgi:hypothetical protein
MLTSRQKEILLAELKMKKLKTKSQGKKEIIIRGFRIDADYLRQVHSQAKIRAKKAMEDLAFLAREYPGYVDDSDLLKFVASKLSPGTISLKDRKRKPRLMRSKKYANWVQVAGTLHSENGAPLIKPEINKKVWLAYNLLESVHESLAGISLLYNNSQVLRLNRKNEKIDVTFSRLTTEKLDASPVDVNTLFVTENVENCVGIKVESTNATKLKILILENEDNT